MSQAYLFRQFAEEAMRDASKAKDEREKHVLEGLACVWAQAAMMSDVVFGTKDAAPNA
jgi:hypothetical protein